MQLHHEDAAHSREEGGGDDVDTATHGPSSAVMCKLPDRAEEEEEEGGGGGPERVLYLYHTGLRSRVGGKEEAGGGEGGYGEGRGRIRVRGGGGGRG